MLRHFKSSRVDVSVWMELRPSGISGVGVFAVEPIARRQKVADGLYREDFDKLVPWTKYEGFAESVKQKIDAFCVGTPRGFVPPADLDFNKLSIEWYFNHSCSGNLGFNDFGDSVALDDIRKGEELTYDYGIAESNPRFQMPCGCKAPNCRLVITGDDWKLPGIRETKGHYMLPQVRQRKR